MLCLTLLALASYCASALFIPGPGCGTLTQITTMEKLPEDPDELAALRCVLTEDAEGMKKIKAGKAEWHTGSFGPCSAPCGGGEKTRSRQCRNATHELEAEDCGGGELTITFACNTKPCTADGYWNPWSSWSVCVDYSQSRSRSCNAAVGDGEETCEGTEEETNDDCIMSMQPVDGVWEAWSDWSTCTDDCAGGTQMRSRTCEGPFYSGAPCSGNPDETVECNLCGPGVWLAWSDWSECSKTCDWGWHTRTRECQGGVCNEGEAGEGGECNMQECPVLEAIDHLMVVGGVTEGQSAEVINLSSPTGSCSAPDGISANIAYSSGAFLNQAPLVCGTDGDGKRCYTLPSPQGPWHQSNYEIVIMGDNVVGTASAVTSAGTLLVTGGFEDDVNHQSWITEVMPSSDNSELIEVSLPKGLSRHNFLAINSTHYFLVNGRPHDVSNVWMYVPGVSTFYPMPPMSQARSNAIAGVVTKSDGSLHVVVTGGDVGENAYFSSTEVFDVELQSWSSGVDFPVGNSGAASVPFGSTFLAVGGWDYPHPFHDKIWRYDPDAANVDDTWVELPQRLQRDRIHSAAFLVSANYCF